MVDILKNGKLFEAEMMDEAQISAVNDGTRKRILELLEKKPRYPAEIAKELGIEKQKVYYHIEKLKDSGLIEKDREEKKSGGLATFYRLSVEGLIYHLGGEGRQVSFGTDETVEKFLSPLVQSAELNGYIVVGSPDPHGQDQVRARDGHLAGEVALKLGEYCGSAEKAVKLDTDIVRDSEFDRNLLIIGGVLTNTVAKKFNSSFLVRFEGEQFPYRMIDTPKSEYSQPEIGAVAKATNPESSDKSIFLVAGVQNKGTVAAVEAFKELEEICEDYTGGDFYVIVRGLDMDGDGEIDEYEIVEKSDSFS